MSPSALPCFSLSSAKGPSPPSAHPPNFTANVMPVPLCRLPISEHQLLHRRIFLIPSGPGTSYASDFPQKHSHGASYSLSPSHHFLFISLGLFSTSLTFGSISIRTHGQGASMDPIFTSAKVSRRCVDSEELPDISCLQSSLLTVLLKGRQVLICTYVCRVSGGRGWGRAARKQNSVGVRTLVDSKAVLFSHS